MSEATAIRRAQRTPNLRHGRAILRPRYGPTAVGGAKGKSRHAARQGNAAAQEGQSTPRES